MFLCDARSKKCRPSSRPRIAFGSRANASGAGSSTKEQLAGFCLIDARDLNEAIQLAERIPPARVGSIEVRPVRELSV
jgi:hypothetical protein